ncbi:hypothetical protein LWI29_005496 [Acer saccharum]|uniref:Uncharacterized protein n=1 Tax=Acer saccharum TaxID=4024 RepID=A0AA39SWJ1_ACESA|nr:hypothetical protein LWI29_005496 [Acer saccharum]
MKNLTFRSFLVVAASAGPTIPSETIVHNSWVAIVICQSNNNNKTQKKKTREQIYQQNKSQTRQPLNTPTQFTILQIFTFAQLQSFNFAQLPNTKLQILHDFTLDHDTGHGFATSHDSSDFLCLRRRTPVKQRTANNLDHFDAPENSSDLVNRHLGFDPGRLLKILVVVVTANSPVIMAAVDGKMSQLVTPSWADSDGKTTSFGFELLEGLAGRHRLHLLVWVVRRSSSSYYGELWKAWIGPSERRRRRKPQQRKEMKAKLVRQKETEMKMKSVRRKETKTKAATAEGEGKVEERERRKVEVLEEI